MNTSERYDAIYTADPHKWQDESRDAFAYEVIDDFLFNPRACLDYGCGNGHTIEYFRKRWKDTKFVGVDISHEAICLAAQHNTGVEFHCNYEHKLLPYRPFDVILVMGVAEHFTDLRKGLKEVKDLLAPGGLAYLECPNNLAMSGRQEEGWFASQSQEEWHLRRQTWEDILEEIGFKITERYLGDRPAWEFVWVLG